MVDSVAAQAEGHGSFHSVTYIQRQSRKPTNDERQLKGRDQSWPVGREKTVLDYMQPS